MELETKSKLNFLVFYVMCILKSYSRWAKAIWVEWINLE